MKTETVLFSIALTGVILRFLHLPGGSMLLVTALTVLALLYLPFSFYFFCDKTIKQQNLPLSIVAGILLSVTVIGILFVLMHWPGGANMLLVGNVASTAMFIPSLILLVTTDTQLNKYYRNMLIRTSALLIISGIMWFY
ncbi:hypothetical protein GR160_07540 [Flavobacterium sp. Sd200]|uniref:GldL-related protein n=1 Tax=Flavobacterium sp. Sd200 TaxID=2692211 RepID=UPI001371D8A4|nr:hypothetical protein [Flavobacterium sp. Sd200]MXN91080.1 hypothetical protein [Flavobacterium sp. Sd200]